MTNFLKNHLNAWWLRPESALWDAIASNVISKYKIESPSLDLGCSNGIFSFITAGGNFSLDYDWHIDANVDGFWQNKDIYNNYGTSAADKIEKKPEYKFTYGLDHKKNLLEKAKTLNFYENLIEYDANKRLPFENSQLKTIFSNIIYWLDNPKQILTEFNRVLQPDGKVLLCIPDKKFYDYCRSYIWKNEPSELLKLLLKKLNRGRAESIHWSSSKDEFLKIANKTGFEISNHRTYLSRRTLEFWDVGLRPISSPLTKMANKLSIEDRRSIKSEWVDTLHDLLDPLYKMDIDKTDEGGFHFFVLKKSE